MTGAAGSGKTPGERKRGRGLVLTLVLAGVMLSASSLLVIFSVPLYRMFCAATGIAGTTRRVAADTMKPSSRVVTIHFSTNVAPDLPWRFVPEQNTLKVHLGQQAIAYFRAQNLSKERIVAHATYNVTPYKVGPYFNKIQCFCFTEEALEPGQSAEMPVVFFVDPALAKDPNADEVEGITLSYTFFRSPKPKGATELGRFNTSYDENAPASAKHGKEVFEQHCSVCHTLDRNKVGPSLRGVFGRTAGTVVGYPYSDAVRKSGIIWSKKTLDDWLRDPQKKVPGTKMPLHLTAPVDRRDVIEFLRVSGFSSAQGAHDAAASRPGG